MWAGRIRALDWLVSAAMTAHSLVLSAFGQAPAAGTSSAPPAANAPGVVKLTGGDQKRARELEAQIDRAQRADRWDEAIAKAESLLALRAKVQGPKHFETVNVEWGLKALRRVAPMPKQDRVAYLSAETMDEQAERFDTQGKYAQAEPLFESALAIRRRLLTDDHPDTASSYDSLARNLNSQGKYGAAQPLFETALAIRRRLLADDHPDTAGAYVAVASNLNAQGKYEAAQPLLRKALAIDRRILTDDHPDTAAIYGNLAYNLDNQGKYGAAQPLYEKALAIDRRLLTDDHLTTAGAYGNLAYNLDNQGKYAAAQPLHEKALAIIRRLLTDDHPDTARAYNNLAANLFYQAKYAAAQPLYEKALAIDRRLLTDGHPHTAFTYSNLAVNLEQQGNFAAAQPLLERALAINRRLLSDDHPDTARAYNNLAMNLYSQRKYAVARPLFEIAIEIWRRLLTDDHPDTAKAYSNLAANLSSGGNYAAALPLYERALAIQRRLLGDDHPETARSYSNVAASLGEQGKSAQAQPLCEKALAIQRRLLTDEHPNTAASYYNVAFNLAAQGRYAAAQPLFEKALEIERRLLGDSHPDTVLAYSGLASTLYAQSKYDEARNQWRSAARSLDAARLKLAFAGLERAGTAPSVRPELAGVLARFGQRSSAWQTIEEDLGRGLLDELAARKDKRLTADERDRVRELTAELERLDRLAESTPRDIDRAERAKRFEGLTHQRERTSIALGEFQTKLDQKYGALAGRVAGLDEIQAALPADAALIAWIDIPPVGPNAADPDGENWGVVVRSQGVPAWIAIDGTGDGGLWTKSDLELPRAVRGALRGRPGLDTPNPRPVIEKLRTQRISPLSRALGATTDGLPPARRLIVLSSTAMAGISLEALLASDGDLTISYAPSATVYKYLREQPRADRHAGLLALGDPIYERPDESRKPLPLPDHGMLVNVVLPGSNAATHGLKAGDVLLAYNGQALKKKDDLNLVDQANNPIPADVWTDGRSSRRELAPGKLGVVFDSRPAPLAIAEQRRLQKALLAARSGDEDFAQLPGTGVEVETLAQLFKADDRPVRKLVGPEASEPELDRIAAAGELGKFAFIHLATHGLIDEAIPQRSAVILTQTGLPDPLEQVLNHKPVFDGRLLVREIQRTWELKAELVTLSACETALGREAGGEGFVGFTQALLMSGARSVCLSLWKVDDTATMLLMQRFYANLLGRRPGLAAPMPKAEALREAKAWLRGITRHDAAALAANLLNGVERGKGAKPRQKAEVAAALPGGLNGDRPFSHPFYWAAFVLVGDPD
jgi:tetratricopeptide (TPR) repeat protein